MNKKSAIALIACSALILIIAGAYLTFSIIGSNTPQITVKTEQIDTNVQVVASPPMGMRKTLNYNNMRYAFLENGAAFKLENIKLGENLGEIKNDITADPKLYSNENFSASYAVGGKIHSLPIYHPDFRIAVTLDNNIYICERVALLNDKDMDLKEYIKTSELAKRVDSIDVYDHFKRTNLKTLDKKHISTVFDGLSSSVPAVLENEDYQKIGSAQKNGKSFSLLCHLNDSTTFQFFLIPELSIAMVGDERYQISDDFKNTCLINLFDGLKQNAIPIQ